MVFGVTMALFASFSVLSSGLEKLVVSIVIGVFSPETYHYESMRDGVKTRQLYWERKTFTATNVLKKCL